jgi:DNA-binding NtrC family response regulator
MKESNGISSYSIVLVDDEPETLFSFRILLESVGLTRIETFQDSPALLPYLTGNRADVVVLDLQMPHISGRELLQEIVSNHPHISVIIITAAAEIETAVACMRMGAVDYLVKPIDPDHYLSSINKALEVSALKREIFSLREAFTAGTIQNEGAFAAIKTRSTRMRGIFGYLEGIAPTAQPVLISGETGAGKELVALALHRLSGRDGEFVAVNIAGLDDMLLADTLFGHTQGAFTGAARDREGMVAKAAGGTLFLDEIGDLSLVSQVKLLRLLQEGQYHPLGSDQAVFSNARIVVATNGDLRAMSGQGTFRKDLFYRLCAHEVHLPALRERPEDIPILLEQFLAEAAEAFGKKQPAYPPDLISYLSAYHFPGNVRELRAMVFDALARHKGGVLSMAAFREAIGKEVTAGPMSIGHSPDGEQLMNLWGRFPSFKEMEECLVTEALKLSNGNQGAAAALLGISRQALNKRISSR